MQHILKKIYFPNNVYVSVWNSVLYEYNLNDIEIIEIDENTLNINVGEEYIKSFPENIAIVIVHNGGNIINVPRLKGIKPDIVYLEDNCEGLFGKYEKHYSGT